MGYWESNGASNEWYSPKYIFDALGENFDLDVANGAPGGGNVPCRDLISAGSLETAWVTLDVYRYEGDIVWKAQKSVRDVAENYPETLIFLDGAEATKMDSLFGAASVHLEKTHPNTSAKDLTLGGQDEILKQPRRYAAGAKNTTLPQAKTSLQKRLPQTDSLRAAENATERLQESGCSGSDAKIQKKLRRQNEDTANQKKEGWPDVYAAESTMPCGVREDSALRLNGVFKTGKTYENFLTTSAHTAGRQTHLTKTILSRCRILTAPAQYEETWSQLASTATYQKEQGVHLSGLTMLLRSRGYNEFCGNIVLVNRKPYSWCNPPFGGRNGIVPWLDKFFRHGNGIALTPDRTSATWWQDAARKADATLFIHGKVKFERPDGSVGKAPSNGTTLFAAGPRGVTALRRAAPTLGILMEKTR